MCNLTWLTKRFDMGVPQLRGPLGGLQGCVGLRDMWGSGFLFREFLKTTGLGRGCIRGVGDWNFVLLVGSRIAIPGAIPKLVLSGE